MHSFFLVVSTNVDITGVVSKTGFLFGGIAEIWRKKKGENMNESFQIKKDSLGHMSGRLLWLFLRYWQLHFNDVIMGSDGVSNHRRLDCLLNRLPGADQRNHQSSASLAFVRGIHRKPVDSPHKGWVTRKMFPSDDVFMYYTDVIWTSWRLK